MAKAQIERPLLLPRTACRSHSVGCLAFRDGRRGCRVCPLRREVLSGHHSLILDYTILEFIHLCFFHHESLLMQSIFNLASYGLFLYYCVLPDAI